MFRKSCKCKTKICKCGKRKIRGGVGENNHLGHYNFQDKDVYCFSDIEGNMPTEIFELMNFNKELKTNNPLRYTKKNLENKAIVFTGDLIDRGAYSIRNLWNMNQLKTDNPTNVILVCGNRDLNKIRMYHECCIPYIEDKILISDNKSKTINEIFDLLDSKDFLEDCKLFKHNSCEIAENINIPFLVNPHADYKEIKKTAVIPAEDRKTNDLNFRISYRNDIYRIKDIYENTLGSPNQIKFFKDEFEEIFKINFDFNSVSFKDDNFTKEFNFNDNKYKKLLKFIAMMNMVMGKIWDDNILPTCLNPYNGLYIRYLQGCHIMAVFTKDDRLCFVSHSGVPYNNDGGNSGFFIPSNIGSKSTFAIQNNKDANIKLIKDLNKEFFDFIKIDINYKSDEYKKYVAMSAACGNIDINDTLKLTSEASPVVSNLITNQYDKRNISLKNLIVKDTDTEIKKIYNIYGHVPTGLLPTVRKNEDDGLTSYHIGLDISKAENGVGISNKLSYVYLKIDNKDDTLTGKTITNLPYDKVINKGKDVSLHKYETIKNINNTIQYQDIVVDIYFKNIKKVDYFPIENTDKDKEQVPVKDQYFYTTNEKSYYGIYGYILLKYDKPLKANMLKVPSKSTNSPKLSAVGGGKNNKTYAKSDKRFMNGKRQMVIYLGKRGCEYVKTAGEYVSLTKFVKTINKNKK